MESYNIYLIGDAKYSDEAHIKALVAGVDVFQIREKNISTKDFYIKALKYKEICEQHKTKFIVNDRIDIALAVSADGLHIGQDDLDITICKKLFPNKIIGVSVTNLEEAIIAEKNGATYIGVGAMFETNTKSDAKYVSIEELKKIRRSVKIPIVCIGGINLENASSLIECDIEGLAICSEILKSDNISEVVSNFKKKFKS